MGGGRERREKKKRRRRRRRKKSGQPCSEWKQDERRMMVNPLIRNKLRRNVVSGAMDKRDLCGLRSAVENQSPGGGKELLACSIEKNLQCQARRVCVCMCVCLLLFELSNSLFSRASCSTMHPLLKICWCLSLFLLPADRELTLTFILDGNAIIRDASYPWRAWHDGAACTQKRIKGKIWTRQGRSRLKFKQKKKKTEGKFFQFLENYERLFPLGSFFF